MMRVGIAETKNGFRIVPLNSEKSASVKLRKNLLEKLLENQETFEAQTIMKSLHDNTGHSTRGFRGFFVRLKDLIKTENAFWHIHGIIATATVFYSGLFFWAAAQNEAVEQYLPLAQGYQFAILNLVIGLYGLYALYSKRRVLKRRSAFSLSVSYMFYVVYFAISGFDSEFQTGTTLAFLAISLVLYFEWSKPSKRAVKDYDPVSINF